MGHQSLSLAPLCGPGPEASASPGRGLEMHCIVCGFRPAESESARERDPQGAGRLYTFGHRSWDLLSPRLCARPPWAFHWLPWGRHHLHCAGGETGTDGRTYLSTDTRNGAVGLKAPSRCSRVQPRALCTSPRCLPGFVSAQVQNTQQVSPLKVLIPSRSPPNVFRLCKRLLQ